MQYEKDLKRRGQCRYSRSSTSNGGDFPGQHHWLELDNNPRDEYIEMFEREKLVWIELVDDGRFAFAEPGIYTEATAFILTCEYPKYWLGLLNSKLVNWYFDTICGESGTGTNRWKKFYVERIPLPAITDHNQSQIEEIENFVETILNKHKDDGSADTNELETQIDQLVYGLYGLTEEEIKIVEGEG